MEREPVSTFTQLKAMIARNVLLKKRMGKKTLAECVVPLWFLTILIVIYLLLPNPNYVAIQEESADSPLNLLLSLNNGSYTLYIVPNNTRVQNFARQEMQDYWLRLPLIQDSLLPRSPLDFVFLESELDLELIYASSVLEDEEEDEMSSKYPPIQLAIIFGDDPYTNMTYTIRNNPDLAELPVPSQTTVSGDKCRNPNSSQVFPEFNYYGSCPISSYYWSNFLAIQGIVEGTWLKLMNVDSTAYLNQFTMQLFPKAPYVDQTSLLVMRYLVPFYMVLTLSQFILYLLTFIVGEKEKKIKEGLRIMGLSDAVYWFSWFAIYFVFVVVLTAVATGILFALGVFKNSNPGLIYLLFILYDISVLTLAFLITPFFDKARVAGLFGAMAVSFLNLFYYIYVATGDATPAVVYWILALISPTGFALGMDRALTLEISDPRGVQLETLWEGGGLPLAGVYIMLSADIVLYLFFAYYLDNVLPSEYGAKRPPWFLFLPSFWCRPKSTMVNGQINTGYDGYDGNAENNDIEKIPDSMKGKEVLRIRNLSKTFKPFGKPEIKAVRGLNLDVYEGQITAILGHNGAGKTTLFNMLTGMTAPTSGSAFLYGYDLSDSNQLQEIRRMTGVCPQHDVLFDQITPREHLVFFAKIRGVPEDRIDAEVEQTLKDIDLTNKQNTMAAKLSGGQKRKLSIGIALIGDPKIVFLDEPTAGVDPYSRRHLWNLLQQRKAGKVILLTTHFMDEADLLADRKAIVSKGKLRCLGSSLFLKNKFGLGYHLTFVLNDNFHDTEAVRRLVGSFVRNAKVNRHFGRELSYVLPREQVSSFPPLFGRLEELVSTGEAQRSWGFNSYGVSMTTLEEVFLKLGEEAELAEAARQAALNGESKKKKEKKADIPKNETSNDLTKYSIPRAHLKEGPSEEHHNATWELLSGLEVPIRKSHKAQTFGALLKVRLINMMRDPMAVFFQVLMPVAFAALGIWLGTLQTPRVVESRRQFNLSLYPTVIPSRDFLYSNLSSTDSFPNLPDLSSDTYPFWEELTKYNDLTIANYTGEFNEILQLLLVSQKSHWMAADVVDTYDLRAFNESVFGGALTMPSAPWPHTRLRFNDSLVHTPPIILNEISNTLLRMANKESNISLNVFPLPYVSTPTEFDAGSFTSAMFIGLLFVLAPSALACEIVLDREVHAKNLLRVNGLTFGLYYGTFFMVLGSMMVCTLIMILALIFVFNLTALITPWAIAILAALYLLFVPASILFATCCSYLFKTMESAQSIFPNVSSFVGFVPYIVVMLCDTFAVGGSTDLSLGLHIGFTFIDILYIPYGILYYVNRIYFVCLLSQPPGADSTAICGNLGFTDYMTTEVIVMFTSLILVQIPFWWIMLIIIDVKKSGGSLKDAFPCFFSNKKTAGVQNGGFSHEEEHTGTGDSDVISEKTRVHRLLNGSSAEAQPVVLIHELNKKYQSAESDGSNGPCSKKPSKKPKTIKPAVQSLSFAVGAGEVFGLLGHNGAGKTTTMKVITAEEAPTHGRVQVAGHDITSNQSEAFQALGYCPQHDALWRNITVREHMETYAAIRGIEPSHIKRIVDLFLRGLQIEEHANKFAKNCSGGTRRKLSYALSMLGRPAIVLMDEPSTGMDPQSKRFLWNTISASFQGQRGAILTTHSMEEADALCSRLGIMVKGEMRCLGTGQHLKNRYGSGYLLELKLKSLSSETSGSATSKDVEAIRKQRKEELAQFIRNMFSTATIQEDFEDRIIFNIAQESIVSLAQTFQDLEEAREKLSIEEYSFSQTTLEQVFIKFANEQEEEDDGDETDNNDE